MLRKESIESVIVLAKKAAAAGLTITPISNTPLALAMQNCYTPELDSAKDADIYSIGDLLHVASTRPDVAGSFPHDDAINVVVDMVSGSVQKNLLLARTIVNPQVLQLAKFVEDEIGKTEVATSSPVAIVPDYMNGIWASTTLETMVGRYEESFVESMPAPQWFDAKPVDEILGLLNSGSSAFDKEVDVWTAQLGADFFNAVYCRVFMLNPVGSPALSNIYDYLDDRVNCMPLELRNRALAVYLMARSMKGDAPEGADMPLNVYREKMSKLAEQAGRSVAQALARRRSDIRGKLLIPFWPNCSVSQALATGTTILVTGEVYDQWIANGGSPDIILGAFVTDQTMSPDALLAGAEKFSSAWSRTQILLRSQAVSGRFNGIIRGLIAGVQQIVNDIAEDELVVVNRNVLMSRCNEVVSTLSSECANDLYGTARKVLCFVLYAHTDAEKILQALDRALAGNPDLDVREGALYAVIDMMAEWLLKLVDVRIGAVPNGPDTENEKAASALATLATAIEIGVETIDRIAGNEISNQVDGAQATNGIIAQALSLKLQNKLQHLIP